MTTDPPCPNVKRHTKCPEGYLAWHEWAEKKAKTHKPVICGGCGRFAIWIKKEPVPDDH